MKIGDLVRHVPRKLGFARSDYPAGAYLVTRFLPTLDMVSILDTHGRAWTACRAHLEVVNESR